MPEREAVVVRWGLISALTKAEGADKAQKLSTFNARSESAAESFTFGNAWRREQRCIVPAEAVLEPDWRSGKAVSTSFRHVDGASLNIAGLWDKWRSATGDWIDSYTMLTINADQHPLFRDYHRPGDEKRMVVILSPGAYEAAAHDSGSSMPKNSDPALRGAPTPGSVAWPTNQITKNPAFDARAAGRRGA